MSNFEWPKMYKAEENLEREAREAVIFKISEHYNIEEDDIYNLSQEQMDHVMEWRDKNVNEFSIMWGAFTDVYNHWQNENEWVIS